MWFLCFGFFAMSSAFPLGGGNELDNYRIRLVQNAELPRHRFSICLPSPFLGQVCLPSALQLLMPLQTFRMGQTRCLSIPIMRTYAVKVCPPREAPSENFDKSFKETTEEVGEETERVPDNANVEVNDEEVKGKLETEEAKAEDKNFETKNKIVRTSEEIEVGEENNSNEPPATDKNAEDENISITYNLV